MVEENNGGPAFPQNAWCFADPAREGMSLRDWFAGQALLGILSGPAGRDHVPMAEWFDAPEQAYRLADAMIAAREGRTSRLFADAPGFSLPRSK